MCVILSIYNKNKEIDAINNIADKIEELKIINSDGAGTET